MKVYRGYTYVWLRAAIYEERRHVGTRAWLQEPLDGEPTAPLIDHYNVVRIVHVVLLEVRVSLRRLTNDQCSEYTVANLRSCEITSEVAGVFLKS